GADVAAADRLVVMDKISFINPLPISYLNQIAAMPGVDAVTHASWFGGFYQEPQNTFGQFPTDPEAYMDLYPELNLPEEQMRAWRTTPIAIVAGQELVDRFGWELGDRIPLQTTIWTKEDGSRTWEFELEGILTTDEPRSSTAFMLLHHEY